jgi:DNA-binding transcriptional LysR family regulator
MIDVKRLRVLHEVAKQGSFSAAADALSYTQSAVSQQIAALERETGTLLVERNARGIRMTDAGEALVRHADAILMRLTDAEAELEAIAGLRGGRVRLASFATAGSTFVPHAIATFHERYPDVEISLKEADPEESVPLLKAGQLDVATLFEPHGAGDLTDVEKVHLLEDPMSVVLPQDHPLASKAKVRLKDLEAEAFVQTTASCPCCVIVADHCRSAGFEPYVAFESDDYLTVQGLVAAGVGVALIPSLGLAAYRPDVAIKPIAGATPKRDIYAVALPSSSRSPATQAMIEVLVEAARRYDLGETRLAIAS